MADFGNWKVLSNLIKGGKHTYLWCQCSCGVVRLVRTDRLRKGLSKSCGCVPRKKIADATRTHGRSLKDITYASWTNLKSRCKHHPRYKERGINVTKSWYKFENFLADMGDRPSRAYSIERINNQLGYFKENCKWATQKEQVDNRETTIKLTHNGHTATITDWAKITNLDRSVLQTRIYKGWSVKEALTTPRQLNQWTRKTFIQNR